VVLPKSPSKAENPIAPGLLQPCAMYAASAVKMLRILATAEASFALILARIKLGIAIAAIIKITATTINNSMSENPFCLRILNLVFRFQASKPEELHEYAGHPGFQSREACLPYSNSQTVRPPHPME
jgi:hypothetical protein